MPGRDVRFAEFYDRFHRHVHAYCHRRTQAAAVEDAVAETFLAAWRKADEIPPGEHALPWLYGVAHRVLTHQWRTAFRSQRLAEKLSSLGVTPTTLPEEVVILEQEASQILAALAALNATDREILRLTAWEELSHDEIALALGISVGAVRQRSYVAKKKLANEYNRLEARRTVSPAAQKGGVW
ncbi:MAG: RNA polymerase sigma factor [Actinomycetota bacterium]